MISKTTSRILFTVIAFVLGVLFVFILSIAGNKSKGPIENILDKVAENVINIEDNYILNQRNELRKNKLVEFEIFKKDIELLRDPQIILLGASDKIEKESFEAIINLEDSLKVTFPLIHIYNAWGSKPEEQFPVIAVKTILELGSIPVITWEPWLSDFNDKEYPGIPPIEKRDKGCLSAIAKGTYDEYIRNWAIEVKGLNSPIFIRLAHEMNDPYRYPWGPQNNSTDDFVDAWRHVHEIFDTMGVDNVLWIWAPHPAYEKFGEFYPGSQYVDYIGVGVLNFGTSVTWSKWWTFDELFGKQYLELTAFNKPIMITEFGSLSVGGNRSEWFDMALKNIPLKYQAIKSLLFFHYPADNTITNKEVSWYFIEDEPTKRTIIDQFNSWPDSIKLSK